MLACLGVACPGPDKQNCQTIPDPREAAMCLKAQFDANPPATEPEAYAAVSQVKDPFTRQAMIEKWLETHRAKSPEEGKHLCSLEEESSRSICERKALSPHLQRP